MSGRNIFYWIFIPYLIFYPFYLENAFSVKVSIPEFKNIIGNPLPHYSIKPDRVELKKTKFILIIFCF